MHEQRTLVSRISQFFGWQLWTTTGVLTALIVVAALFSILGFVVSKRTADGLGLVVLRLEVMSQGGNGNNNNKCPADDGDHSGCVGCSCRRQTEQFEDLRGLMTNLTSGITSTLTNVINSCCAGIQSTISLFRIFTESRFNNTDATLRNIPNSTIEDCARLIGIQLTLPLCEVPTCANASSAVVVWATWVPENGKVAGRDGYCEVRTLIDNETRGEIHMPAPSKFNGIIISAGGGGFDGTLAGTYSNGNITPGTSLYLNNGYVYTTTDGGHDAARFAGGDWGLDRWQRWQNYFFRSRHLFIQVAKQVVAAYYKRPHTFAVHSGCSNGGHAGIMEASMFPEDYDAVLAGAPLWNYSTILMYFARSLRALKPGGPTSQPLFEINNFTAVRAAVVAKCDLTDGIADGWIANPRLCTFDPTNPLDLPGSWTTAQRNALATMYTPVLMDGVPVPESWKIYPGFEFDPTLGASGLGWTSWVSFYNVSVPLSGQLISSSTHGFFLYHVWRNVLYPFHTDTAVASKMWNLTFTWANWSDMTEFARQGAVPANNFGAFFRRNGKLLIWNGYQDPAVAASGAINNYNIMAATAGGMSALHNNALLYLTPEAQHCGGDSRVDFLGPLITWMRGGARPNALPLTHVSDGSAKGRIVCPEPLFPVLINGTVNPDLSASWQCNGTVSGVVPQLFASSSVGPSDDTADPLIAQGMFGY